jgi:hypothetical protein
VAASPFFLRSTLDFVRKEKKKEKKLTAQPRASRRQHPVFGKGDRRIRGIHHYGVFVPRREKASLCGAAAMKEKKMKNEKTKKREKSITFSSSPKGKKYVERSRASQTKPKSRDFLFPRPFAAGSCFAGEITHFLYLAF